MKQLLLIAIAVVVVLSGVPVGAQSGYDLFQKALAAERADGNLRQAIQMYERVVKQFASDRPLVARALIRIAECQEKLGQRDAAKVYERIVREFGDQPDSVAVARARLTALQAPALQAAQTVRKLWSGPDADAMGTPSADGRLLSFTNWVTGDLGLRDLADGANRMLTNTGGWEVSGDYAESSVVSPDGRQVLYAWFVDKGTNPTARCTCRYELRTMSLSGSEAGKPRVVLPIDPQHTWVQPAAWMPDGKTALIVRSGANDVNYEIALVTFAGGAVRVLKTVTRAPHRVSLSPDGQFVALDLQQSAETGPHDIAIIAVNDGRGTTAVQHPGHDYSPVFTADGSNLLFLSDRTGAGALWRLPLANGRPTGAPVLVAQTGTRAYILGTTRSGGVYYWTGGPGSNVYVADLDDDLTARAAPRLAVERFINANGAPSFSPDGQFLAYQSRRSPVQTGLVGGTIVLHSLATGQDRELSLTLAATEGVSWFPDSRSLLVAVRSQQTERRVDYFRVDVSTGQHERLMTARGSGIPQGRPKLSPDGQAIFFVERVAAEGPRQWVLARYDIATAQTTALHAPADGNPITSFQVSPDGSEVAYLFTDNSVRRTILEVIPSGGGTPREIYRDRGLGQARYSGLAWTRDKRYVLIVRENDLGAPAGMPGGSVWKVPTAGGEPEPTGIAMPNMVRFLTLDPSQKHLAFAGEGGTDPAIWAVENFLPRK